MHAQLSLCITLIWRGIVVCLALYTVRTHLRVLVLVFGDPCSDPIVGNVGMGHSNGMAIQTHFF